MTKSHVILSKLGRGGVVAMLAASSGLLVGAVGLRAGLRPAQTEPVSAEDVSRQQTIAFNSGGYRAAAAVTGSYTRPASHFLGSPASVHQLVTHSKLIVVGRASANEGVLSPDGRSIYTLFTVQVQEQIAPAGRGVDTIGVAIPGGRVSFPDGSWAQEQALGFGRLQWERSYLMLLRPALTSEGQPVTTQDGLQVFEPTLGGLGLYDLTDRSAVVRPVGGRDVPLAVRFLLEGTTVQGFLGRIRSLAHQVGSGGGR